MSLATLDRESTIAVVDDDQIWAEQIQEQLEDIGHKTYIVSGGPFEDAQELALIIQHNAYAAICDHVLSEYALASFSGSQLVACLYDLKIPAVLITQYVRDSDTTIRQWRNKIPLLMTRNRASNPMNLEQGLEYCSAELGGTRARERKPRRTLIRVERVGTDYSEKSVEAFILGWNPHEAVRFPLSLLPLELQKEVREGTHLSARVNIGADKSEDLFFEQFELVPEPDDNDGLA